MDRSPLILGAGLTGLSCAHHWARACRVLEREAIPGGLARTTCQQGFFFDQTGHWLHFTDPKWRAWIETRIGTPLRRIERRAEVFLQGQRTPYPFQVHTFGRPVEMVAECVLGYFSAREAAARGELPDPQDLAQFIQRSMGAGIARHFMVPYNTKLWTVPPETLSCAWCQRFVVQPTPSEIIRGALAPDRSGLGYNATFYYPPQGGIGQLAEGIRRHLTRAEIRCQSEVARIDWQQQRVWLEDQTALDYTGLISTMPLPALIASLTEPPPAIRTLAQKLRAASVTYWDVGLDRPNPASAAHWTYFPEPDLPFYRVGSASAALPHLCPPNHRSYYVEVSHPHGTDCPVTDAALRTALETVGLLGHDETPLIWQRHTIPIAYVIMDHKYGTARTELLAWLEQHGILSVGRYGGWTYGGMEDALADGQRAAQWLEKRS